MSDRKAGTVLLDLGSDVGLQHLARFLHEIKGWIRDGKVFNNWGGVSDIDTLIDAINEALPKPRIPEPGLWGVVEAGHKHLGTERSSFVRVFMAGSAQWVDRSSEADWCVWSDLIDPVLIRDGVEDAS